jgi:hypothetical protein
MQNMNKVIMTAFGLLLLYPPLCFIYRNLSSIPLKQSSILLTCYYGLLILLFIEYKTRTATLLPYPFAYKASLEGNPKIYSLIILVNALIFALLAFALWDIKPHVI